MTQTLTPDSDPTLKLAERQMALLGELVDMAMTAARAFNAAAIASAKAEEMILGEEWFTPEVGRAKACGAKAAAESLTKVLRAVRLTVTLQMNLAEVARDIRAGKITYLGGIAFRKDAGEDAGAPAEGPRSFSRSAGVLAGPSQDDPESDRRSRDSNTEHLIDIERPDAFLRAPFRETVDDICDDVGARVDWTTWRLKPPEPTNEPSTVDADVEPPSRGPPVPARPSG